ncbi:glycogen debranching enzyme [Actinoplanes campanulatus]|uniref:Glycogen debranching enzyme n=1 Tax=Actinoplanes campanulatus TaxID=113559 RepID=A0A7W5FBR7_9ACTN|nr:amylo-alpha-1,6-glucosidase [Actinoplanes campanulatus]MBB3092532.1 glycogen debranching enzyme [Actinoplanes campanulatus]GGM97234.1 glycogen debranching protein [Actinoplanes campanulatus]GID34373.1 glycogen debranching protein [Actinoplanes campanulatus]
MPRNDQITFGPQVCGSVSAEAGGGREWLVTDGLGGYAAGTISGLRTRRRHALLVTSGHVALTSLDLTVTLPSGVKIPLYTHEWASGAIDPAGHTHLEVFRLVDGLPRWRWRIGDVVVERELAMRHGHPSLAVTHRVVSAPGPIGLAVAAMCTWRTEGTSRRASGPALSVDPVADGVIVEGAYRLHGPGWQPAGFWHVDVHTRADGADDDLWHAGSFFQQAGPGQTVEISVWAGTLGETPPPVPAVIAAERERAHRLVTLSKAEGYGEALVLAADRFVIRTPDGPDVVAGYPGQGRWAGDTMIAYEGLFLDTGRVDEGRELLISRTRAAVGEPSGPAAPWLRHDPLDAPLWLVHAVDRHVSRTGDGALAAKLAIPLGRLLRHRLDGSGPLSLDPADGLLRLTAPPGAPGDLPAVPRVGKPVEINALWVNALAAMCELLGETGRDDAEPRARLRLARESFQARFPAPEGWLYDVIEGPATTYPLGAGAYHDDPSLRPYQLLAWSLPYAPMRGRPGGAVQAVGEALLTPLGLRTLAPSEYGYQSSPPAEPDPAYHQGAVWTWLIGPYADACAATGQPVEGLLTGLAAHLRETGVGSLGDTAEGDSPHRATGCLFSARSVAEVLRVKQRYLM